MTKEKRDYEGFFTRPMSWERVTEKFTSLCPRSMDKGLRNGIIDAVSRLEEIKVEKLMKLLGEVSGRKK